MAKVLVTVPNEHWIHTSVVGVLLRLLQTPGHELRLELPAARPYENNLHGIVRTLLEGDYDYWLSMDADNAPQRNPLDLIADDCDIVGCPTPIWHYTYQPEERPIYWNAYWWDPGAGAFREWTPREGLQEVDAVGSGCLLIARRVFEHPALQTGAFAREVDEWGRVTFGADLAFCRRARAAGFRIWCHFDYPCSHVSEVDLDGVARAIKGLTVPTHA